MVRNARHGALFLILALSSVAAHADALLGTGTDLLNLRDPFRRPDLGIETEGPKSELETFPADQLKMLGVLTGPKKMKAMLLAPNGKTYFVTVNTKVGQRSGTITRITDGAVYINEKVVNLLGQQEDLETVLNLPVEQRTTSNGSRGFLGSGAGGMGAAAGFPAGMQALMKNGAGAAAAGGMGGGAPGMPRPPAAGAGGPPGGPPAGGPPRGSLSGGLPGGGSSMGGGPMGGSASSGNGVSTGGGMPGGMSPGRPPH